jgi:tRNA-specific 2-thiouridylase
MVTDYTGDNDVVRSVHGVPEHECGCDRAASVYNLAKVQALTDEELQRLSEPLRYDLQFETEVYRSGKRHVKKTRWKPNPYGAVAGRHEGAQFYTVGQRKGLNIGGHPQPVFVIGTDVESNRIYVGEGHTHKGLSRHCARIAPDEVHWIREDLRMRIGDIRRYRVRVRYRQPLQDALLICRENGLFVLFDDPQRGLAPGQFAAWYDRDELIGSGVL